MPLIPQMEVAHVVILGKFNPAIFHPAWFLAQQLLRPQETQEAEIRLIHPEAAVMRMEWLQLEVVRDRFQASTTQPQYFEPLRDLVTGVFSLLAYTPISALGINRDFHYSLATERQWHALGHRLAPPANWPRLNTAGLFHLSMQGERNDDVPGYTRVIVEPSPRFMHGVSVSINHHFDLSSDDAGTQGAARLVESLASQWEQSMQESVAIAQDLIDLVDEE
jgi:hypothetical protein